METNLDTQSLDEAIAALEYLVGSESDLQKRNAYQAKLVEYMTQVSFLRKAETIRQGEAEQTGQEVTR